MIEFFKTFGKGILYFIGFPFLLVFLCLCGLYLFVIFIITTFKNIILFFKGKNISLKDELDIKAMEILKNKRKERLNNVINQTTQQANTINNTYNNINVIPKELLEKKEEPKDYIDMSNGGNNDLN